MVDVYRNADVMEQGDIKNTYNGIGRENGSGEAPNLEAHREKLSSEISPTVEECPEGYPRLAALLDSDESFMVYRRFGFLQSRLLLYKQDELRELENDLDLMDEYDGAENPFWLRCRQTDDAHSGKRKVLMEKIEGSFREYASLLTMARDLVALDCPHERDYRSVKYYFDGRVPLVPGESYIYKKEDIVSLKPGRENTWLDATVETLLIMFSSRFVRYLFSSADLRQKADAESTGVTLFKKDRIGIMVSLIITTFILMLLIIPVFGLWFLTKPPPLNGSTGAIVGVLLASTFSFSIVLMLFTRAKRHEILAAAAAYCAVLVVFIGNVGQMPTN